MAIDPICQMTVDEKTELRAEHEGRTYYFCSPYCVAAFKKDPARFIKATTPAHVEQPSKKNESVATDPVCGMSVEPARAAGKQQHNGQLYYFCSRRCLAKFNQDPDGFLSAQGGGRTRASGGHTPAPVEANLSEKSQTEAAAQSANASYVCPMDPEVREPRPGACPKCGMALEPTSPSTPAVKTEYVCPMHPEIVRDEPGSCPICGMALEPRTVTLEEEANPELLDMTRRFWFSLVLSVPLWP